MPEINLPTKLLQDQIKAAVDAVKVDTTSIKTNTATANLGAPATAASNATSAVAHAKLNWLLANIGTLINGRTIKSIQRGKLSVSLNPNNATYVKISPVDFSKSISIVDGTVSGLLISNPNGDLTIHNNNPYTSPVPATYWQVIEFY